MITKAIIILIKLSFLLPTILVAGKFDRIHFLHHSTGRNLITEGGVYDLFNKYNQEHNTSFQFSDEWSTPSGNYPYDYYIDTFSPDRLKNYVDTCDVIIFKHCFPGSDIAGDIGNPDLNSSRKSLENYTLQYRALRDRFDQYPDTKFIIMTIPPRHRNHSAATPERAARANEFAKWVLGEFLTENGPHYNIGVFDFRSLLTDSIGYLKYEYEKDHNSTDCHPNKLANETIGPLFFNAIIQFCNQRVSPPIIYKLLSPTISAVQLVSGIKSPAADTIEIVIPTAIVGTLELSSDTTWQVLIEDMSEGWNYVTAIAKSPSFLDSEPTIDSIFVDSVNDPPANFFLVEPDNDYSTYDSLITFIWRTAIDLDPYDEVNYQLELCDSSDFNAPLTFEAQTDTSVTIKRPGFGDYWWHVKAIDKQLAITYSNETRKIRFTGNNPPSSFSLVEPENNYLTSDSLITFMWRHATDLDPNDEVNYRLELCDSSDFSMPIVYEVEKDTIITITSPGLGDYWWRAKAIDKQLAVTYSDEMRRIRFTDNVSSEVNENTTEKLPNNISLKQNYPNPFNSSSLIQFQIIGKSKVHVTLTIANLLGHTIKILVDEYKLPGIYTVQWDGKGEFGEIQNSGVYFCTIQAGAFHKTIKLMLIK